MKNVIYQIVNLVNGKRYIGSAVDFRSRKKDHRGKLRRNVHGNCHLQNAYNKYGKDNFVFEIIDTVPFAEELIYREEYWWSKYDFDKELYNILPTAGSPLGFRHSEESKQLMSEKQRGENHPLFGKSLTDEHKQLLSEALSGENNPMWGKTHTIEARDKISKAKKIPVRKLDKNTLVVIETYDSMYEAQCATGIDMSTISKVCRNIVKVRNNKTYRHKTAGGFKWCFADEDESIPE